MKTAIISAGAVCLALFFAPAALADQPPMKGQGQGAEANSTGTPSNPNGFGSVVSQRATDDHDIGTHASSFAPGQDPNAVPAQRLGVGNVARNDQPMADAAGVANTGTRPGDHGLIIGALTGYDAMNKPGNQK